MSKNIIPHMGLMAGINIDPSAQAFLDVLDNPSSTVIDAINNLVVTLKEKGVYSKIKALYPFVGSTATDHKWNLIDPRDLDVAFRLTFFGGWTHSSTGAYPNAINSYADTHFNTRTDVTKYKLALGYYSRTDFNSGTTAFGVRENPYSAGMTPAFQQFYNGTNINTGETRTDGQWLSRRNGDSLHEGYRNAVNIVSDPTLISSLHPNYNFYYGALNITGTPNFYTQQEIASGFLAEDFTDQNAIDYGDAIITFQTELGRNV